jgi:AcrR family transcriptional regulator
MTVTFICQWLSFGYIFHLTLRSAPPKKMGLREEKARKTRRRIFTEALQLFKRDGYEQTTMEAIAEAAEVSLSTLYRYFPSKDLILLDSFTGDDKDFAAEFSRQLEKLPAEEALAESILAFARWQDANAEEILLVRSLIDRAPSVRAKMWDVLYQYQRNLNARLAETLRLPEDDLRVVLAARLVISINSVVADHWRANAGKISSIVYARRALKLFAEQKILLPRQARSR